jgi:nicotinate phosphoribosyltransferase
MQFTFFGKSDIKICGIEESVALIKASIKKQYLKKINIYGLKDGDIAKPGTSVLLIVGQYQHFGHLENVIDGILARRCSVCNNCYQVLKLIKPTQLIYMADRTDDYLLQPYDGYAAYIGGVRNFVTQASVSLINDKNVTVTGTMPHALIQQHNGNLVEALKNYVNEYGDDKVIALIDYHNDIQTEIHRLANYFSSLYAIRLDTSSNLIDKGLLKKYGNKKHLYGINPQLVSFARQTLNDVGFKNTKIIISSGLNYQKINNFIKSKSPVDFYGIGSSLITRNIHFTADLVLLNNKPEAKFGRKLFTNINKLKKYI